VREDAACLGWSAVRLWLRWFTAALNDKRRLIAAVRRKEIGLIDTHAEASFFR
jgi:hypothetical protein